jgi:predicted DNA-binding WGR domain protein
MDMYLEEQAGVFYFISVDGSKVLRAIGKDGLYAYKREQSFATAEEAESFARKCRERLAARGFEDKEGKPGFDLTNVVDWSNLVKDYTRYFESPAGDEFWYAETRRDPTHNLMGVGRGVVGVMGTSIGTSFGKNNDETIAEIDRLCALQAEAGFVEKTVPDELVEWTTYGSILANLKDPRAPEPLTLDEALKKPTAAARNEGPSASPRASSAGGEPSAERLREIAKALASEYRDFHAGKALPEALHDWPACLELLDPFEGEIAEELPEAIADAVERDAPEDFDGLPIKIEAILGTCPMWCFVGCPNLPEHHQPDFYVDEDTSEKDFKMIRREHAFPYRWSDIALTDAKGKEWKLRLAYNTGDGDSNDGYWGAAWSLDDKRKVADISSTGDIETTIEIGRRFSKSWAELGSWLPDEFDLERFDFMLANGVVYKTGHELERLLRLAMIMVDDQFA